MNEKLHLELVAFAHSIAGDVLDLYQMRDWGCDFEEFKRHVCGHIEEVLTQYTIEDEDEDWD